ncbi:sigma-70 family RNA polymerase sigma factor [Propioniferax innocua]|uniref:RNA polymerase primary sigma factor n=1 Tax=Propioniferax innocua TaxID=1753 RepID=A0A542ZQX2_9ACTN|nr:sigma-70 family RNA polymerase sigma factor [Propioniferax innocua]TQL62727.1 RNA polymerase primary sigma factor [Propioniferax innocua]
MDITHLPTATDVSADRSGSGTYRWSQDQSLTQSEEDELIRTIEIGTLAAAALDGQLRSTATRRELGILVAEGQRARERYLTGNLGLVLYFANRAAHRFCGSVDDLVQEGFLGLVQAMERFDPDAGVRFATYASSWIRAAIDDAVRRESGLGRHTARGLRRLQRVEVELEQEQGRRPRLEELAARTGRSLTWVSEMVAHAPPLSLDDIVPDVLPGRPDPGADDRRLYAWVASAIETLPEDEGEVVRRRFGLDGEPPRSLEAVAAGLRMSKRRCRRLEQSALARLRVLPEAA